MRNHSELAPAITPPHPESPSGRLSAALAVPRALFEQTFDILRDCGKGRAECQVLWIGSWRDSRQVTEVVHPIHRASRGGFHVDDAWLTAFWHRLAERKEGVWAQVHTHPADAFHSATDDAWPMVHLPGFFSLVIPDFAIGATTLSRSLLAQLGIGGRFHEVPHTAHITLV